MNPRIEFGNYVIASNGEQIELATAEGDQRMTIDHADILDVTTAMQTLKRLTTPWIA